MFFTPLDIQNAEFKKSMYGYSDEEVDVFLDKVMNDYQEMRKEIDDLQGKISILNDGMKQYKSMETSLKETLILAQQTAEEVREEAVKKANNIIKEAELKADEIVQSSRYKLFELNQTIKELKIHALSFKAEYISKLESELAVINDLIIDADFDISQEKIDKAPAFEAAEKVEVPKDDFAEEVKEKLDAVFAKEEIIESAEEIIPVNEGVSSVTEDSIDDILDELFSEDVGEDSLGEDSLNEAIEFFSSKDEEAQVDVDIEPEIVSDTVVEKTEPSFKERLFRRHNVNVDNLSNPMPAKTEYKSRFIADLDSDDVFVDKDDKADDTKSGEIKKWFLDD